jgi:predicted alternative tryptophan synthase beta-subunit
MSQSGIASALDLNRFNLKNGVYLVRVKTMEKTYSSKVMMSR